MTVEEKILENISWLRIPNTPIKFYYLKEHIIVEFNKTNTEESNSITKYAIYCKDGREFNSVIYTSFKACLLEIAKRYR